MNDTILNNYQRWTERAIADVDVINELKDIAENEEKIEDAFYKDLAFGTGGLRGVIGAGTNRLNVYTVAKASQGLADYVIKNFAPEKRKIAVSFDSRIKSDVFAKVASGVFAANGIKVEIYSELMPTPCLSFAVRYLGCAAGVMVTASHNPAKYNGYKVYGADGCQITTEAAAEILAEIEKLDIFDDVKRISFEEGFEAGKISYISEESGYTNITVVKEQEQPDGTFPTCPYPNPEVRQAMELGIEYAKKNNADLLLATDPDCDRVGIAVKNTQGEYVLLSGNETGMLLLDYICSRRTQMKTMPEDPVTVKTIVTIDMAERIAAKYGVKTINVLTGFKFIGEQIGFLEKQGKEDSYIFGMEESYGYLSGSYVRDKDGVNAAFLICEMFTYYASQGIGLFEKLNELYAEYGYCLNTLHSYTFEGSAGFEKMQNIMVSFRKSITEFAGKKVLKCLDYSEGIDGLPKSDVLKFFLEDNCSIVVRPSGTEPKLKAYISVSATTKEEAQVVEGKLARAVEEKM